MQSRLFEFVEKLISSSDSLKDFIMFLHRFLKGAISLITFIKLSVKSEEVASTLS